MSMKVINVENAVIGAGTAGLKAYRELKKMNKQVLLIEGDKYGTTCARVGCMPSKLLIAAAEKASEYENSKDFGVTYSKPIIDGKAVMNRIRSERDRFVNFITEDVDNFPAEDKIKGHASFVNDTTLQIDNHTQIHAKKIIISAGSSPISIPSWKSLGNKLVTNDDIFNWEDLPKSVVIMGPGVIGLEIGQALSKLGVQVYMFGLGGKVGPLTDPDIMSYASKFFKKEFYLDEDAKINEIEKLNDSVRVNFFDPNINDNRTIEVDYLISAVGRKPNVDKLGLQNTTLKLDDRGVPKFNRFTMQTNVPEIFIAGDASNEIPLLHEAADQGEIAGHNAAIYPEVRAGLRRTPISVVFTHPQIAMVGETFDSVKKKWGDCEYCFKTGSVSFEDQGRARVMLKNIGLLHVYGEQGTGRFLGAEMIGPAAEHVAHLLAWAHQNKMTVSDMLKMPFYHPVIEEGLRTALRELNAQLDLGPQVIDHCLDCGPGC